MQSNILAIDIAKDVFEVAVAKPSGKVIRRHRLNRLEFREFLTTTKRSVVVIEACGSSSYWARLSEVIGQQVKMIPAHYVSPYRRRGKTDRIDTDAILEAHRCGGIEPVPIRSIDDQQIQHLHRVREHWKKTRVQRVSVHDYGAIPCSGLWIHPMFGIMAPPRV